MLFYRLVLRPNPVRVAAPKEMDSRQDCDRNRATFTVCHVPPNPVRFAAPKEMKGQQLTIKADENIRVTFTVCYVPPNPVRVAAPKEMESQ